MKQQKIAVLGGGMGAMCALYWITSQPSWEERYDITLYQMGWRVGGKGASGRDQQAQMQIQEHGFHALFGFYQNTLSMMMEVYKELGRSKDAPLSEFLADDPADEARYPHRYAMKRAYYNSYFTPFRGRMHEIPLFYPGNNRAIQPLPDNSPVGTLQRIWDKLIATYSFGGLNQSNPLPAKMRPDWWAQLQALAPAIADAIGIEMNSFLGRGGNLYGVGRILAQFPKSLPPGPSVAEYQHLLELMAEMLRDHLRELWAQVKDKVNDQWDFYELWVRQDLLCTMLIGLVEDRLMENGYDSINHLNFIDWFTEKGTIPEGTAITASSIMVESIYDFGFAFHGGNTSAAPAPGKPIPGKPDAEAGTMLRVVLRWMLDYFDAAAWMFQAACGEVLFAPLYEVLQRRGVKFKFFHKVKKLTVDQSDKTLVSEITIERQVDLSVGEYDPLILVNGLPCWPSQPLYDQINPAQAKELQKKKVDLESTYADWQPVGEKISLRHGEHFDLLLYNIPPGAFSLVASDLLAANPRWQAMKDHLEVVKTEGFQMRLNKDLRELGWKNSYRPMLMVGDGDLNTICAMNEQIQVENWPPDLRPKTFFYFVSVMRTDKHHPSYEEYHPYYVKGQQRLVKDAAIKILNNEFIQMFPGAAVMDEKGEPSFDWNILVDPQEREGQARLQAQYWRANIDPGELYVLSVVGSSQYRLKAGETGFKNLVIAGDWIHTGINVGCMEGAVMSGMQAARAICGFPVVVPGELDFDPTLNDPRPTAALEEMVVNALDTGADFYGYLAKAIAKGLEGFREEVSVDKLPNRPLPLMFLTGALKGSGNFFSEIQEMVKHVSRDLSRFTPDGRLKQDIDYDKLARMVADELSKRRD